MDKILAILDNQKTVTLILLGGLLISIGFFANTLMVKGDIGDYEDLIDAKKQEQSAIEKEQETIIQKIPTLHTQVKQVAQKIMTAQNDMVHASIQNGKLNTEGYKTTQYLDAQAVLAEYIKSSNAQQAWTMSDTWEMSYLQSTETSTSDIEIAFAYHDNGQLAQIVKMVYPYDQSKKIPAVHIFQSEYGATITNQLHTPY